MHNSKVVRNPQDPVANRVLMQEQGNNKVEMVMQENVQDVPFEEVK
jgi:hypothetical protein